MTEGTRPAPPYPPDTRARGWRFEVDMEKVKASDTWLRAKTGEIRGALLLLWGESWQQTPCGTLPADDELVALIIDMPLAKFAKHRHVLMRGWWLAEDGRLYHETITDRVLAMLDKRATDAQRAANYRARKGGASGESGGVTGESRVTNAGARSEFDTKHQAPDTKHQLGENPPKPPRKRGSRGGSKTCPDEFLVTEEMVQWAQQNAPGVNLDRETVKFRNHEFDKPKTEWAKTWMNWMLRASERGGSSPDVLPPKRPAAPAESFAERDRRLGMERWEQMTGQVHPDREPRPALAEVIDQPLTAIGAPA